MIKVMHVDNVFEVFLFFLIFSFKGVTFFVHEWQSKNLTRVVQAMRKKYLLEAPPIYHRDHGGRLIPASYVVPKINQY
jgi:hypothetical protein